MTFDDRSDAEKEITPLFDRARERLKKIDANAKQQKKQVIDELAKSLEGKIPMDTIALEIKHQLKGEVSERYIDECLDDKYKQSHRVQNAKKQKKSKGLEELGLAAPTPLEYETDNEEEILIINSDGQVLLHKGGEDEDPEQENEEDNHTVEKPDTHMSIPSDKITINTSHSSENPEQDKYSQVGVFGRKDKPKECLECAKKKVENDVQKNDIVRLQEENAELSNIIKQFDSFTTADQMNPGALKSKDEKRTNNRKVLFSVNIPFEDLRKKMQEIFAIEGENVDVTISGDTDVDTGISTIQYYGRSKNQS